MFAGQRLGGHPILEELADLRTSHPGLSRSWFMKMIAARQKEAATPHGTATMEELDALCEGSMSSSLYLMLEGLGVRNIHADHAASHIGKAVGLANRILHTDVMHGRRNTWIPQSLLLQHGLVEESLYRAPENVEIAGKIANCMAEGARHVDAHLSHARSLRPSVPPAALPVLRFGIIADDTLALLWKHRFATSSYLLSTFQNGSPFFPLKLSWSSFRSTY